MIRGSCNGSFRWVPEYGTITLAGMWAVRPSGPNPYWSYVGGRGGFRHQCEGPEEWRSKSMLMHVDKLKLCKGETPKAWLSGVERDATELEDAEDEEEVRQPPEEHGDELQRMEGVEHATMNEARSDGGSEEKPAGQEVATNSATVEHLLGPRNDPGRPTRSRQALHRLLDYVREAHAATNERSPIVLENVEGVAN